MESTSSSSVVLRALQHSSKGSLHYKNKLKNQPWSQKIITLDECNPLPSFPTEIKSIIAKKWLQRSSEDIDAANTPDLFVGDPSASTITRTDSPAGNDEKTLTVIDELSHDLTKCEQSLDDRLLIETHERLEESRKSFRRRCKEFIRINQEQFEKEEEKRYQRMEKRQESMKLLDIHMSLSIQKWKKDALNECRMEEEKAEALLIDGEQQAKKSAILKERRRVHLQNLYMQHKEEVKSLIHDLTTLYESCMYPQYLPSSVNDSFKSWSQKILTTTEESMALPNEDQIYHLQAQLNGLLGHMRGAVQEANQIGKEEAAKVLLQQEALKLEQEKKAEEEKQKYLQEKANQEDQPTSAQVAEEDSIVGMPKSVVSQYTKLQDMISSTILKTNSLSTSKDPVIRRYRFELQKAVTCTVNSISASSGEDLIHKIGKLRTLIGGHSIDVMGKSINVGQHPEAKLYCSNLFAKKIVKQGEDQVSAKSEAAFCLAAAAIGIWSKFPEIGDLIVAHFHCVCPILVPLNVKKSDDITDVEHLKLQGYKVSSSGIIETDDKFLDRMRGIVRLYAAIISTSQLPMEQLPHPYGLDHGWAWLSRILNMEPHPTLTAAALGDFLEIAGHALMKKFGRQFIKLLDILYEKYVPKMEKCTPKSQRGPITRLTEFLKAFNLSGNIAEPKGYLHTEFWRTRSKGIALA